MGQGAISRHRASRASDPRRNLLSRAAESTANVSSLDAEPEPAAIRRANRSQMTRH